MSRQATGLIWRHSAPSESFSATTACETSVTTTPWTMTLRAIAAKPSTMPATAVMAIDPAMIALYSSDPVCTVSSREKDAQATPPTATSTRT